MADEVTIYHNPRCSKSRAGLKLLQEKGIEPNVVKYLDNPPTEEELDRILNMLEMEPYDLLRKREQEFKDLNLKEKKGDRQALIKAMTEHPRLIERPIAVKGNKAALGRPTENIEKIL